MLVAAIAFTSLSAMSGSLLLASRPLPLPSVATIPVGRVILEPAAWVGQLFPLREHLAIGEQLSRGSWLILLYHHDCGNCADAIAELASGHAELGGDGSRLALVEVPPLGNSEVVDAFGDLFVRDRLAAEHEWVVSTPVFLWLEDGTVERVGS